MLGQSVTSAGRDQLCLKGLNKRERAGLCYETEKWEISLPADKNEKKAWLLEVFVGIWV